MTALALRRILRGTASRLFSGAGRRDSNQSYDVADNDGSAASAASAGTSCGWSVTAENRRGMAMAGISIRRFPFPYRCAVSVNNDTDGMRAPAFEAFHNYVSGRKETPFGQGLGLEVADSFWVWAAGGEFALHHAPPWEDQARTSPEHDRILELARAGWLDTLHGFGAWNGDWTLDRDRIAWALDYLSSRDVNLKVYVGHGGYNMTHNFGGPWGYYHGADDPKHKSYCFDLLTQYGFKYHWTDVCYELDKFGDDLIFEGQAELDQAVATHDFNRFFHANDPADYSRSREVFPGISDEDAREWRRRLFNHTIVPVTARDGRPALVFKRFRGHDGPMAGNFVAQVNPASLDALESRGGAVVVYQHFGVWRGLFMGKKHPSQRVSVPETVLDEHNIWAFRELAQRHHDGRIMVATTRRLLDFLWMRDGLDYSVRHEGDTTIVEIDGLNCPSSGRLRPTLEDLAGLAFEVPKRNGETVVVLDGEKLPMVSVEDPQDPERIVVYLPWQSLTYPE